MMMKIKYAGLLSPDQQNHIRGMTRKYSCAIEANVEGLDWKAFDAILPTHVWYQDNDPGLDPEKQETALWGKVTKDDNVSWLFFKNDAERMLAVMHLGKRLVHPSPFQVEF